MEMLCKQDHMESLCNGGNTNTAGLGMSAPGLGSFTQSS